MRRRDFLWLLSLLGSGGCRFEESPYSANPTRHNLNAKNIGSLAVKSQATPDAFSIAVVSDSHTYYDDFLDVVHSIREKGGCDFLIHGGDITDSGLLREFEWGDDIVRKANLPYVTVIGNHDALANGRGIYLDMYGYYNFSFVYNRAHVIVLNNNNWEFGADVPDFEWLETELASKPLGEVKMVAAHIPPFDSARFSTAQSERFHTLMQTYAVSAVISGHKHNPLTTVRDGITYITVGSVNKRGYVLLHVTSTGVTMERVSV